MRHHPTEKLSGGSREGRRELASILEFIRPGDVLVVHKLDRLGRNTRDVLNLVHELDEKGACLRVLEPAIDTWADGPHGDHRAGMVAEMELGFIRDRQRAGIEAAKVAGVCRGRPVKFDRARILELRKQGMGATEIAKAVGASAARSPGAEGGSVMIDRARVAGDGDRLRLPQGSGDGHGRAFGSRSTRRGLGRRGPC